MTASWSGSRRTRPNTRLRREFCALSRAPLGSLSIDAESRSRLGQGWRRARGRQHRCAPCGGLRPVLTAAARGAFWCPARGEETALSRTKKHHPGGEEAGDESRLTEVAPYKVQTGGRERPAITSSESEKFTLRPGRSDAYPRGCWLACHGPNLALLCPSG